MDKTISIHQSISESIFGASEDGETSAVNVISNSHSSSSSSTHSSTHMSASSIISVSTNASMSTSTSTSTSSSAGGSESATTISMSSVTTDDGVTSFLRAEGGSGDSQIKIKTEAGSFSVIQSGDGNDVIIAGDGNDLIDAGAGDDVLTGGQGVDLFRFAPGSDADIITDFEHGVDKIDISAFGVSSVAELTISGNTIELGSGDVVVLSNVDTLTEDDLIL